MKDRFFKSTAIEKFLIHTLGTKTESALELDQATIKIDQDECCSIKKIHFRQWVMWLNFMLVQILLGMASGYSAIVLQQLKTPKNHKINDMIFDNGEIFGRPHLIVDSVDTQSWIASSMLLFMTPGCWILAVCTSKFGRKPILLISVAGFSLSWVVIAFASNANHIIVGRSLSGVCTGIVSGLNYMYSGECAITKLRSIFHALFTVGFVGGKFLCHFIGTWYHWRTTALFSAGFGIIVLILNYYLPESPMWLIYKCRIKRALESWLFLRGKTEFNEFKLLTLDFDKKPSSNAKESKITKYNSSTFWKPLSILLMLFTTSQLSGMSAVGFYCTPMIEEITGSTNAYIPTLILDTLDVGASIILCFSSKKFSTRTLMIFSGVFCSLFLFSLALSIRFNIYTPWSQLTFLSLLGIFVTMGLGPLPWTFSSELFTADHKELGVGIVSNYFCIISFTIVKANPYLFSVFEPWRTFIIYGSLTLIGTFVLYFILPNTKNKTLKQIELLHSSNTKP